MNNNQILVVCTTPRHYKLTEGKEYAVSDQDGSRYRLLNDRGVMVSYYKTLFSAPAIISVDDII